jgi:hypothetical protein
VDDKDKGKTNVIEVEDDDWVTMNYCLILSQSSELVMCASSIIVMNLCRVPYGMFENCGLRTC